MKTLPKVLLFDFDDTPVVYGTARGDLWREPGADVAGAQRAGLRAGWVDARRSGLPADVPARPDRIVRSVAELVP